MQLILFNWLPAQPGKVWLFGIFSKIRFCAVINWPNIFRTSQGLKRFLLWPGTIVPSLMQIPKRVSVDCNGNRTHNHVVCKQTLNHLAKLAKWLSCFVRTYLYGAFDCMFLSCNVRPLKWIYTNGSQISKKTFASSFPKNILLAIPFLFWKLDPVLQMPKGTNISTLLNFTVWPQEQYPIVKKICGMKFKVHQKLSYMFKVNNRSTRTRCGICSKLATNSSRSNGISENHKLYIQKTYTKTLIWRITDIINHTIE